MNSYQAIQRLSAFEKGRPLPRGTTIHFPIAEPKETLILTFVKMGGESAPWGVAWGRPDKDPTIRTVPEPRNRDFVADMMAEFTPVLLAHLFHPEHSKIQIVAKDQPRPLRQIWLPNSTHVEMLHNLAYAYTFTKFGDSARLTLLRSLGRAAGWLFREAQRPGQVFVMVGTEALRESYTFPAEDVRQGHLGYLMAWLETKGGRDARMKAATEAEALSIATSLIPEVERSTLESLVDRFNEARATGNEASQKRLEVDVGTVLKSELTRRFELTARAYELMRREKRKPNRAIDKLLKDGSEEHWYQYVRTEVRILDDEPVFIPSPETDLHSYFAGAGYFKHERFATRHEMLLLDGDEEMQQEAIAAGEALRGTIVDVSDEGDGKRMRPVWVVETRANVSLRLREGNSVAPAGLPERTGEIRSIERRPGGGFLVEIEIEGQKSTRSIKHKGLKSANDPSLKGTKVTLLPEMFDLTHLKLKKLWQKDLPGSWLVKAKIKARSANLPAEIKESLAAADIQAKADDER